MKSTYTVPACRVEKIERLNETSTQLNIFEISAHLSTFCTFTPKYKTFTCGAYKTSPEKIKASTKLEATYKVVIEFIKWYNKNKKDNDMDTRKRTQFKK